PAQSGTCTVRATSNANPSQFGEATVTVIGSNANRIALASRLCRTEAQQTPNFTFSDPFDIAAKNCSPFPPPPYNAPAVNLNDASSGFTYSANYTESLSPAEIANDSISQGTLDVVAAVDPPAIVPGGMPDTTFLRAASSVDLLLQVKDLSNYQLTVSGSFSTNNPILSFFN